MNRLQTLLISLALLPFMAGSSFAQADMNLRLSWSKDMLTISSAALPGREMKIHYIEAYCRPGSTHRKWEQTVIGHKTRLIPADTDGKQLILECTLNDGVIVRHTIRAKASEVDFDITAANPTRTASEAQWAQPCVRVDAFTGCDQKTYLQKSFVFLGGKLNRMPTPHWATEAVYTPGQVWCPKNIDRNDVNPRPLSPNVPSNGLIGCFSSDEKMVMGIAFEPYQELFQGVIVCLHSDFRIGGLLPGQSKHIRGKIYFAPDVKSLLSRYEADFPGQSAKVGQNRGNSSETKNVNDPPHDYNGSDLTQRAAAH